jgi:hypothetical protein
MYHGKYLYDVTIKLQVLPWRPPITTEFGGCATGVTGKIVAASATVALNDIYLAFQIFQSSICNVINLFIQKENG